MVAFLAKLVSVLVLETDYIIDCSVRRRVVHVADVLVIIGMLLVDVLTDSGGSGGSEI